MRRSTNYVDWEKPNSDDYDKNKAECEKQLNHFQNAPNPPKWLKHFRFELHEKYAYIGISYPATFARGNKSVTVELNQAHATFVAEMKKFIIFYQHLC